ncbi:MAG TPA: M56 family metallopeptidase [Verrucomicrobiae bacterium]|nr:M56 family metallopeptidase [Verrucomicrobiae bacterium]
MDSFIEILNQWGGNFLSFAWPMFWQSSLLITLVLALDLLLAKKIRASIRYALWLAVLVKLLLPPTLALPTGAAWWLFQRPPMAGDPAKKYVVSYGATAPQVDFVPQASPVPAPAPRLSGAGGAFLGSVTVSAGLLLWVGFRWRQVMWKVREATVSREFTGPLEVAQRMAGLASGVRLKIVDGQMSPAVCGLFHPVILLPRTLVEKLSAGQLRAVLLHELFHLRRKDVWVNCAQALLQILYWWHPWLWLANARIRRVREEAVDEAVMLALRDEAEDYAPTLLEVAKLAFRRPRLSLGLVGIMESRSALRQRIERLVNFRAPRKAGVSMVSLCGIFAFSAVALPMGQAPAPAPDEFSAAATSAGKTLTMKVNPEVFVRNIRAQANSRLDAPTDDWTKILLDIMRSETVDCSPPHGIAFNAKTGEITTQNTPPQLEIFRQVIEQLNRTDGLYEMPPIPRTNVLIEARCFWMSSDDREKLVADLRSEHGKNGGTPHWIISPEQFNEVNRRIALLNLHPFLRPRIQTAHGIAAEFFIGNKTNGLEFDCVPFEADKGFDNGHEGIALAFRTKTVGNPTGPEQKLTGTNHYEVSGEVGVEDRGGFVVSAVNPDGSPTNVVMVIAVQVVTSAMRPSARLSQPQIHIKARFIELPGSVAANLYLESFNTASLHPAPDDLPQPTRATLNQPRFMAGVGRAALFTGIMTQSQFQAALRTLESTPGVEELAEPEVTTSSGRQTEVRATEIITVITNFAYRETITNSYIFPQTNAVETGPVLDTVASVLPDGYTIDLDTQASLTEFLGYDNPTHPTATNNSAGEKIDLPGVLPRLRVRQAGANIKLWDDQTVVLGPLNARFFDDRKELASPWNHFVKIKRAGDQPNEANGNELADKADKEVLVFITVTLVDQAGNRIHSNGDMPFAKNAIPQQAGIR